MSRIDPAKIHNAGSTKPNSLLRAGMGVTMESLLLGLLFIRFHCAGSNDDFFAVFVFEGVDGFG